MASNIMMTVKESKDSTPYELKVARPDSLNDPVWSERIGGTEDERNAAINDLAWQQWVVKAAVPVRAALAKGERNKERLASIVSGYKYRGGPVRSAPVTIDASALFVGFMADGKVKEEFLAVVRAQLDALASSGATITNIPANVAK